MITVVGDVVSVYDYKHPHGLWKLGSTERLPPGADGNERCICQGTIERMLWHLQETTSMTLSLGSQISGERKFCFSHE